MKLVFSEHAWADYLYWQATDTAMLHRLNELIRATLRDPFTGIGKPEPLRGDLSGFWSRRIDSAHRLVYRVSGKGDGQALEIVACRYHYGR